MMVGDGLNDAGALRQSDVGVAVVEKVGAFSAASDIIIEADQVRHLTDVIALARHSVRVVRAGLWISSAYNLVGVSIAAAGLLSPLVCSILMPLSSVSVVLFGCGATAWYARRCGFVGARDAEPKFSPGRSGGRSGAAVGGLPIDQLPESRLPEAAT